MSRRRCRTGAEARDVACASDQRWSFPTGRPRFSGSFVSRCSSSQGRAYGCLLCRSHGTVGTGGLSLLMGDAPAERGRELHQRHARTSAISATSCTVVDQAEAEFAGRPGTLDVGSCIANSAARKISVVLLVDGCLGRSRTFRAARERLGIVVDARGGEPIYVGPGDAGAALREQIRSSTSTRRIFPCSRRRSRPSLRPRPARRPMPKTIPSGSSVGMSDRSRDISFDGVSRSRWDPDRPNLIRILNSAADRQPVGPQELSGTVSWSDGLLTCTVSIRIFSKN